MKSTFDVADDLFSLQLGLINWKK